MLIIIYNAYNKVSESPHTSYISNTYMGLADNWLNSSKFYNKTMNTFWKVKVRSSILIILILAVTNDIYIDPYILRTTGINIQINFYLYHDQLLTSK